MNHYNIHFQIQRGIAVFSGIIGITIVGLVYVSFIQAFIGIYQTVTALFIFAFYKQYPEEIKKHLNIYALVWLINAILTLLLFSGRNGNWTESDALSTIVLVLFFLIPWSSAIYFITILKKLANWKEK